MVPKREKISRRSSAVVMGFKRHTNKTFSGGLMSAEGRSPRISRTRACEAASVSRFSSSNCSSVLSLSRAFKASSSKAIRLCRRKASLGPSFDGVLGKSIGSSKGSSNTVVRLM